MIVIVDYGGQYVHRIWRSLKYLGVESETMPSSTRWDDVASRSPEAFILSGGPHSIHTDEVSDLYKRVLASGKPVLGICLGHQLIANYFGGEIREGAVGEYAEVEITILSEDDLFAGLPKKLRVWESHRDEVADVPTDLTVLAESDACPVEALKHESKPIYSVQFHP